MSFLKREEKAAAVAETPKKNEIIRMSLNVYEPMGRSINVEFTGGTVLEVLAKMTVYVQSHEKDFS